MFNFLIHVVRNSVNMLNLIHIKFLYFVQYGLCYLIPVIWPYYWCSSSKCVLFATCIVFHQL